jgi:DNA-binding NarL/FixJ family response regulator
MISPLTERECEVVQALASGRRYKQIAPDLGLTESTLRQYVFRVLRKLEFDNRTQLAVWFVQATGGFR